MTTQTVSSVSIVGADGFCLNADLPTILGKANARAPEQKSLPKPRSWLIMVDPGNLYMGFTK
jgi:hypothetical protein